MNIIRQMYSNPIFAGLVGTMLMGSILYVLRAIPYHLFLALYHACTVRLTVNSDDSVFDWVNDWLADHDYAKRARHLKLGMRRGDEDEWNMAPGLGTHFIWDKGPLLLKRSLNEKQGTGYRLRESFEITTLGRSQGRLREIINQANKARQQQNSLGVRIWQNGYWMTFPSKTKRSIDSVFLPPTQKAEVLRDVRWFFDSKKWFTERGVPYRYGILLHGIPGTGKSSTVTAIASEFNKPIYIINLATVQDDNALLTAFLTTSPSCIILIEDVDCIGISAKRASIATVTLSQPGCIDPPKVEESGRGITLSGLLNAIDGVASTEGRLLFMTTNHIVKLDPALIRDARIDKTMEIGPLSVALVEEMAKRFFSSDSMIDTICEEAESKGPMPAAFWQTRFMNIQAQERA